MGRVFWLSALVAAVALVAAGCGGSDSSSVDPTEAWANDFCSAVSTWKTDLQNTKSQFTDASNLSEDNLRSAADDVQSSTQTLVDSLKGLGKPPTDSGQQVQDSVDSLSTTLDDQSNKIKDTANGVTSITGLPSAITTLSTSLSAMATAFSQTLQTIQNADTKGELQTAFDNSADCKALTTS